MRPGLGALGRGGAACGAAGVCRCSGGDGRTPLPPFGGPGPGGLRGGGPAGRPGCKRGLGGACSDMKAHELHPHALLPPCRAAGDGVLRKQRIKAMYMLNIQHACCSGSSPGTNEGVTHRGLRQRWRCRTRISSIGAHNQRCLDALSIHQRHRGPTRTQ